MLKAPQVEELIGIVTSLDRAALTKQFLTFRAKFPLDFTPEFLDGLSVNRLRHILFYLDSFDPDKAGVEDLKERYRTGRVGDVEVKKRLVTVIEQFLGPIRERRAHFERDPKLVDEIIRSGSERARTEAESTLHEVRHAMKLDYFGL